MCVYTHMCLAYSKIKIRNILSNLSEVLLSDQIEIN
jgi:hypothetical protein